MQLISYCAAEHLLTAFSIAWWTLQLLTLWSPEFESAWWFDVMHFLGGVIIGLFLTSITQIDFIICNNTKTHFVMFLCNIEATCNFDVIR